MAYYINLFSPETYQAFSDSNHMVTGFRLRQQGAAANVQLGDKMICYMTKLSRWTGVLTVTSSYYVDSTPLFERVNDPYSVRFHVETSAWLEPQYAVPIRSDICWKHLSFTQNVSRNTSSWTGTLRGSLRRLSDEDGAYLESLLLAQKEHPLTYPLSAKDRQRLRPALVNSERGQIAVSLPEENDDERPASRNLTSEHIEIQVKLAEIGDQMGFKIWLPKADRQRISQIWRPSAEGVLLEHLPMNYNDVTLRTIENIDVLWVKRNAIIHAFEVEHTTSIYSGLLRMADLMTLLPNMQIKAHIVASDARRAKVLREISRPVFALMESGPMSEVCSYLSYESVRALRGERNLHHLNDSVLDDYVEYAQDADF